MAIMHYPGLIGFSINAAAIEVHSLGPLPTGRVIESVYFCFSGTGAGTARVRLKMMANPPATDAIMTGAVGRMLLAMDTGDDAIFDLTAESYELRLPLGLLIESQHPYLAVTVGAVTANLNGVFGVILQPMGP